MNSGTEHGPNCGHAHMAALLLGRTMIGERVWDVMRAQESDAGVCRGGSLLLNRGHF